MVHDGLKDYRGMKGITLFFTRRKKDLTELFILYLTPGSNELVNAQFYLMVPKDLYIKG